MGHYQAALGTIEVVIDYLSRHTYRSDVVNILEQAVKLLADDVPPVIPEPKQLTPGKP